MWEPVERLRQSSSSFSASTISLFSWLTHDWSRQGRRGREVENSYWTMFLQWYGIGAPCSWRYLKWISFLLGTFKDSSDCSHHCGSLICSTLDACYVPSPLAVFGSFLSSLSSIPVGVFSSFIRALLGGPKKIPLTLGALI